MTNSSLPLKITLLGTGSPEPSKRRASSGYLVQIGDDHVLLDCGGGVFDRLLQADYTPDQISHLFFTHLHSDHMMDYARLVHAAWDMGGAPIQVFGPEPISRITQQLMGPDGVLSTDLKARTEFEASREVWKARGGTLPRLWPNPTVTEVEPGFRYDSPSGWSLSSCSVPHAQPYLKCMAFRIDTDTHSFVYSGDAALCPQLEQLIAGDDQRGCDVLLHWCYRLSHETELKVVTDMSPAPDEIAQMATRCGARRLVLTHLRQSMDTPEAHDGILQALDAHFRGDYSIAEDLTVITLESE